MSAGSWWEAAAPLHERRLNILMAQHLASSRASKPREQEGSCHAFHRLNSEFTHHCLHDSLLVTQNNPMWEEITQGRDHQEVRIVGGPLGPGLAHVVIHFFSLSNNDLSLKTQLSVPQHTAASFEKPS